MSRKGKNQLGAVLVNIWLERPIHQGCHPRCIRLGSSLQAAGLAAQVSWTGLLLLATAFLPVVGCMGNLSA